MELQVSRDKEVFSRAIREGQRGFQLRELHPRLDDVLDRHIDSVHHSPTTRKGCRVGTDSTIQLQYALICKNPEDLHCWAAPGKLAPLLEGLEDVTPQALLVLNHLPLAGLGVVEPIPIANTTSVGGSV